MAKKGQLRHAQDGLTGKARLQPKTTQAGTPAALLDTRVIYCGDNLEQPAKLPAQPGSPPTC